MKDIDLPVSIYPVHLSSQRVVSDRRQERRTPLPQMVVALVLPIGAETEEAEMLTSDSRRLERADKARSAVLTSLRIDVSSLED
jgi:hypothetical protein